jgi:hypothetical protein
VAELVGLAERHADVVVVTSYASRGTSIAFSGLDLADTVVPGREVLRRYFLGGPFVFGNPTTTLYRAASVRAVTPFYEYGRPFEDTERCFGLLLDGDLGFVHQVLSYLRPRPESVMGRRTEMFPGLLDRVITLERFGPEVLTPDEFRRARRPLWGYYYERLGLAGLGSLVGRTPSELWEFHRSGLAAIGQELSPLGMVRGALRGLAKAALRPLDGVAHARDSVRRRQGGLP